MNEIFSVLNGLGGLSYLFFGFMIFAHLGLTQILKKLSKRYKKDLDNTIIWGISLAVGALLGSVLFQTAAADQKIKLPSVWGGALIGVMLAAGVSTLLELFVMQRLKADRPLIEPEQLAALLLRQPTSFQHTDSEAEQPEWRPVGENELQRDW